MIETAHFIFILVTGLCLGSFASLLAYRWPRRLPWAATRSQCPACGHVLGARDLVPLLSWLSTLGKCRYCGTSVSVRYPILEMVSACFCIGLYALIGWHWLLIPALVAVPVGMALALISFQKD